MDRREAAITNRKMAIVEKVEYFNTHTSDGLEARLVTRGIFKILVGPPDNAINYVVVSTEDVKPGEWQLNGLTNKISIREDSWMEIGKESCEKILVRPNQFSHSMKYVIQEGVNIKNGDEVFVECHKVNLNHGTELPHQMVNEVKTTIGFVNIYPIPLTQKSETPISDILEQLHNLSRIDKIKVIQFLAESLA